jgi:hypothetical protein
VSARPILTVSEVTSMKWFARGGRRNPWPNKSNQAIHTIQMEA